MFRCFRPKEGGKRAQRHWRLGQKGGAVSGNRAEDSARVPATLNTPLHQEPAPGAVPPAASGNDLHPQAQNGTLGQNLPIRLSGTVPSQFSTASDLIRGQQQAGQAQQTLFPSPTQQVRSAPGCWNC